MKALLLAGLLSLAGLSAQAQQASTYAGTLATGTATSTALIAANVTLAPNSGTLPTGTRPFNNLVLTNVGTNVGYVCPFGGTCSASAGGLAVAAGATVTLFLATQTAPTVFSTSGTTFSFHN